MSDERTSERSSEDSTAPRGSPAAAPYAAGAADSGDASSDVRAAAGALVEHFFRHEAGRLVAVLSRRFGLRHLELVEDMVQGALLEALRVWGRRGVPDDPAAWLHRVARNKLLDALRRHETFSRLAPQWAVDHAPGGTTVGDDVLLDSEIVDSQLQMVFACCHPSLARENQIALTLKTLGGFGVAEIGRALLASDETIKKRLQRARRQLLEDGVELAVPPVGELQVRLAAVHQSLYLMFNEGYATSHGDAAIREDLCEEAARLSHLLCEHPATRSPSGYALLALMLFHASRFGGRTDACGRLLLLEEQDRRRWNHDLIRQGRRFLDLAASGRTVSSFHLEAGVAWLHCAAPDFASTDWPGILRLYDALVRRDPSPVVRLNRAIAMAQVHGPEAGLAALAPLRTDATLRSYYLLDATLGELSRRAGRLAEARRHFERARDATQSPVERELLARRAAGCGEAAVAPPVP